MHEPAFGFVCLRPGETELSNKNKSQINYGPEQGARRFVLTLYALQTPLFPPLAFWRNDLNSGEGGVFIYLLK